MTTTASDSPLLPNDVPPHGSPLAQAQSSSDRLWSVLCHLSYFFGFALLSFLFPLIVYLVMRTESAYVTGQAREALNFHLSILVYAICCVPLCFLIVGFPLLVAIGIGGVVCSIIAAVKASRGESYQYPLALRFVR